MIYPWFSNKKNCLILKFEKRKKFWIINQNFRSKGLIDASKWEPNDVRLFALLWIEKKERVNEFLQLEAALKDLRDTLGTGVGRGDVGGRKMSEIH